MTKNTDIVQKAADAVQAHDRLAFRDFQPSQKGGNSDGTILVHHAGDAYSFCVNIKTHLHAAMLDRLITDHKDQPKSDRMLIVTDQIADKHADILIKAGIPFIDTAGNVFINLPGLYIATTGRRLKTSPRTPAPGRAFQRTGLKLVFAALTDPHLNGDPKQSLLNKLFRDIAKQTGMALGSVGWILRALQDDGYIVDNDDGFRVLIDRKNLLQKWTSSYTDRIYHRQTVRSFSAGTPAWWQNLDLDAQNWLWGGEVAAAKLAGFLKPYIITLYGDGSPNDLILRGSLRPDDNGNVQIRRPFWTPWPHAARKDCTHPLLVYADLLASDIDRNMDAAQRIYDQYLRQIVEAD
jgi:hypothetical protein